MHVTNTGYAAFANLFLDAMSDVFEVELPRVDLESVYADDFESIDSYTADEFDPQSYD